MKTKDGKSLDDRRRSEHDQSQSTHCALVRTAAVQYSWYTTALAERQILYNLFNTFRNIPKYKAGNFRIAHFLDIIIMLL